MGVLSTIKARVEAVSANAFKFAQYGGAYGANDPWGGLWRTLSGATFDYKREAGITWENSIVMGGIAWVTRNLPRGRLIVERPTGRTLENGEAEFVEVVDSPFCDLWSRPNPFYSRTTLLKGLVISRMVDGNAHIYIDRNPYTKLPTSLYYVPHFMVSPRWGMDPPTYPGTSTNYIDHWEYRVDGTIEKWKPSDVLLWRDGIDPQNQRRGISPLNAVLREVCADNSASTMAASLLRNNNVPGLVVAPRMTSDGKSSFEQLSEESRERIKEMGKQKWSGDRAGELAVFAAPIELTRMSFSPKDMDLSSLRDVNEERILAQWGIPLAVAGFGAGLEQTKVGATMKAMIELAWDQCIIPMQEDLAEEMTYWGQRDFGPWFQDGERVRFDRSKIAALQDDVDAVHERVRSDWKEGLIKRSEARRIFGMAVSAEDDQFVGGSIAPPNKTPDASDKDDDA